jgi:hypothetical protein
LVSQRCGLAAGRKKEGEGVKEATSTGNNNTKLNLHLANDLSRYSIFNYLLDSAVF